VVQCTILCSLDAVLLQLQLTRRRALNLIKVAFEIEATKATAVEFVYSEYYESMIASSII
jgi:hypothetical protein